MKNFLLLLLFIFLMNFVGMRAQENKISSTLQTKMSEIAFSDEILVWVYFKDKGTNTNMYFSNPEMVVSNKSIKRREKVLGNSATITFRDVPIYSEYISEIEILGIKIKQKSKWLNAISCITSKYQLEKIATLSSVKQIDIVRKLKSGSEVESELNDQTHSPSYVQQNDVNSFDYGPSYTQLQQINVPAVHDSGYTGQGVTICVMDAGFNRLTHDAFLSMNIIAAWDFVNNDPNVGNEGDLGEGSHGTMTLSTIGGFAPGHLIGPAFNSTYILAKTENTYSETPIEEDNWIAAMEWADSIGVDVTSTSLSYLDYDPPYPSYTWMDMNGNTAVITNAADYAAFIGIVVVNSAGNAGYNSSHNTLGAPADGDSVITAGAVTSSGSRSSFSSVGPTVDGRIKPDIMALGSGDVVASPSNDHNYTTASGTSFSCPLSAGVAALILCVNPNLTPMQVREAMRNTASKSSNPDNLYGWGILNALEAIYYFPPPASTFQLSVDVKNGWNLVSVPGINTNGMEVNTWWQYRDTTVDVFRYESGYQNVTDVTPGTGYWMKHTGDRTYNTGEEWPSGGIQIVSNDPIPIHTGWNLISVFECSVDASLLTTTPPALRLGDIYGYENGYITTNTLYPGYSYWFKSSGAGWLNMPPCN